MGYMRRRAIAAQPHPAAASGEMMWVNIGEPKVKRLAVTFSPVQEGVGTPSPDNVRPIRGFSSITARIGGKNLLRFSPETWMYQSFPDGISYDYADGGVTISISREYAYVLYKICYITPDLVGMTFVRNLSYNGSSDALISCNLDGSNRAEIPADTNRGSTIREEDVGKYLALRIYIVGGPLTRTYTSLSQVEIGSVQTEREPYRAVTPSAYLGDTYYSGTVDLVSGTMTVTHATYALTGEESGWYTYSVGLENCRHSVPVANLPVAFSGTSQYGIGLSSHFTIGSQFQSMPYGNMVFAAYVQFNDPNGEHWGTYTAFKEWLAAQKTAGTPVQIYGQLATPQTVQLSPQTIAALRGQQLVMNDSSPNLYTGGDLTWTNLYTLPIALSPGTYRLSGAITSTDTDSDICQVRFMDATDHAVTPKDSQRLDRSSAGETHAITVTTTATTDHIYIYASNTWPHGEGDTATFRKISIERIW